MILILTTPFIERKAWVYGQSLQLKWGEMCVRPCEDKWVFVFEVNPDVGQHTEFEGEGKQSEFVNSHTAQVWNAEIL